MVGDADAAGLLDDDVDGDGDPDRAADGEVVDAGVVADGDVLCATAGPLCDAVVGGLAELEEELGLG